MRRPVPRVLRVVRIESALHRVVSDLAAVDRRTINGEIEYLVELGLAAREEDIARQAQLVALAADRHRQNDR